ncbi:MAG: hypothetical protein IMW91_01735 [Firmicutes bacterium]|nr:hypothetical protein [Bacillota bacterium]
MGQANVNKIRNLPMAGMILGFCFIVGMYFAVRGELHLLATILGSIGALVLIAAVAGYFIAGAISMRSAVFICCPACHAQIRVMGSKDFCLRCHIPLRLNEDGRWEAAATTTK